MHNKLTFYLLFEKGKAKIRTYVLTLVTFEIVTDIFAQKRERERERERESVVLL